MLTLSHTPPPHARTIAHVLTHTLTLAKQGVEPYCPPCWEAEEAYLDDLGGTHRGHGSSTKKGKARKKRKALSTKTAPKKKKASTVSKKKRKASGKTTTKKKKKKTSPKALQELQTKVTPPPWCLPGESITLALDVLTLVALALTHAGHPQPRSRC